MLSVLSVVVLATFTQACGEACADTAVHEETTLFQFRPSTKTTVRKRDEKEDAQFLMRTTFGPTRESLSELQGMTQAAWVQMQMELPFESYREYYRQRVQPYSSSGEGHVRAPCDKGSRWIGFSFSNQDVGKTISLDGSARILVDGALRTEVEQGSWASSWVSLADFSGFVCEVEHDFLGADVKLSAVSTCTDIIAMPNPALWFASGSVTGLGPFAKVRPGVLVLDVEDATCALDEHSIIDVGGSFYRYNPRFALSENSLKSPSWDSQRCIGRNVVNEASCRAPNVSLSGTVLSGLRVEVYKSDDGVFVSELVGTDAQRYDDLVDSVVNHSSTTSAWPGWPRSTWFSARFTGWVTISTGGVYTFSLESDDASRLFVGDTQVVKHDGTLPGVRETPIELAAGAHPIVIEYFQLGGSLKLILRLSGPEAATPWWYLPMFSLGSHQRGAASSPVDLLARLKARRPWDISFQCF